MSLFEKLSGVIGSFFQVGGPLGPAIKNNGGVLEFRDSGDSSYIIARAADPVGNNDLVTLEYFNAHTGGSGETVAAFQFTFATASPVLLGGLAAGAVMNRVAFLVTTAFDDSSASVSLGLVGGSPTAFFGPTDAALSQLGQYEQDAIVKTAGADMLKLTISPGASTMGAAILLYKVL